MLLIFRATTCYSTLSERTTGNRDGLLVIVAFDAGFEKEEAANVADAITNVSALRKQSPDVIDNLQHKLTYFHLL